MEDEVNPYLRDSIMEVVDNQLRDLTPPETKETYDRLISEGHSDEEARRLIGAAVVSEIYGVLKERKAFDEERYVEKLHRLPRMPWE